MAEILPAAGWHVDGHYREDPACNRMTRGWSLSRRSRL